MLHLRGRCLSSREIYQALLTIFILFTKPCYSPLFCLPAPYHCIQSPGKIHAWRVRSLVVYNQHWFCPAQSPVGLQQCKPFLNILPTQTSVPASFAVFIFSQFISFTQPPERLMHIQSFPHLIWMCEDERMSSESYGYSKVFLKCTVFSHSQHWVSADLSEMQALYSSSWPLNLFPRQ